MHDLREIRPLTESRKNFALTGKGGGAGGAGKADATLHPPTLAEQIAELEREIALRVRVYPRMLRAGRLAPLAARRQMRCLRAALETLVRLEETHE